MESCTPSFVGCGNGGADGARFLDWAFQDFQAGGEGILNDLKSVSRRFHRTGDVSGRYGARRPGPGTLYRKSRENYYVLP